MNEQFLTPAQIDRAAELLLRGGIVAFPTDTVYGLGADPANAAAIARLFTAKRRPLDKAIPLLLADAADLGLVAEAPAAVAGALADAFWPGAVTLVVPRRAATADALPTVAVRVPAHDLARALIRAVGGALAVTSANRSGAAEAVTAAEVAAQLGGRIDAILDGGRCAGGVASTVVDTTTAPPRVLRQSAIDRATLRRVAPDLA